MATSVSFRNDVVAVGPILTNQSTATPIYDDVFILAAVISPNSPYFKGQNATMNGYTFALGFSYSDDDTLPPRVFFAESVWGEMLVDGKLFKYSEGTSQFFTCRLQSYLLGESQQKTSNFIDYTSSFKYPVYSDMGGVTPLANNTTLGWDPRGNLAISGSDHPYNKSTITSFQTVSKGPVGSVPGIRTLEAGMRYQLGQPSSSPTRVIHMLPTKTVVPLTDNPKNQAFQGIPYRSIDPTNSIKIPIDQVDIVFLPVKWYNQNCAAFSQVGNDLNFGFYHFCDRWGQLKGTNTPFYTNSCAPQLNNLRGNTNQALCTLTNNILYYPATTGNICGSAWRTGVQYQDMMDNIVTANTSLGPCGDGICGHDASSQQFICYESTDSNGNTCGANCSSCNLSGCADCGTDRCISFVPDNQQCTKDCPTQMSCDNCSVKNKIPIWVWILMVVLLIFVIILFVVWQNRNSNQNKPDDEFDLNNDIDGINKEIK